MADVPDHLRTAYGTLVPSYSLVPLVLTLTDNTFSVATSTGKPVSEKEAVELREGIGSCARLAGWMRANSVKSIMLYHFTSRVDPSIGEQKIVPVLCFSEDSLQTPIGLWNIPPIKAAYYLQRYVPKNSDSTMNLATALLNDPKLGKFVRDVFIVTPENDSSNTGLLRLPNPVDNAPAVAKYSWFKLNMGRYYPCLATEQIVPDYGDEPAKTAQRGPSSRSTSPTGRNVAQGTQSTQSTQTSVAVPRNASVHVSQQALPWTVTPLRAGPHAFIPGHVYVRWEDCLAKAATESKTTKSGFPLQWRINEVLLNTLMNLANQSWEVVIISNHVPLYERYPDDPKVQDIIGEYVPPGENIVVSHRIPCTARKADYVREMIDSIFECPSGTNHIVFDIASAETTLPYIMQSLYHKYPGLYVEVSDSSLRVKDDRIGLSALVA